MAADAVADVLFLPFAIGDLAWPEDADVLFLRARASLAMPETFRGRLLCEQSFKPEADALRRAGLTLREVEDGFDHATWPSLDRTQRFPLVLLLPPRQREEARALLARAVASCVSGGYVVACVANDEGAKSGEKDLARLAGLSGSLSKHHCRVYWARVDQERIDADLLREWSALDAPRPIADTHFPDIRFISRPGVFAWDRIDPASALLAAHLPADLRGRAADLGCGYGYLSAELLRRCSGIESLDAYEAEARALALARRNLDAFLVTATLAFHWHDVAAGLPGTYDVIVTNPPFHTQQAAARPDIGRAFIAAAAAALARGGRLWLVANRQLPYEEVLNERFGSLRLVAQQDGFKVIEAVKA